MARQKPQDTQTPDERHLVDHAIAVLRQLIRLYGDQLRDFRPAPPSVAMERLLLDSTLPQLRIALVQVLSALRAARKA